MPLFKLRVIQLLFVTLAITHTVTIMGIEPRFTICKSIIVINEPRRRSPRKRSLLCWCRFLQAGCLDDILCFVYIFYFAWCGRLSASFLQPSQQIIQPCRTRIIYRLRDGEPESVQDAVDRFYRLENGLWIRTYAGRHKKLWKKSQKRKNRLKQHVFCNATQCRMLDKMVNIEYKMPKYYVDDPYTPYHRKSNLPDYRFRPPKFLP